MAVDTTIVREAPFLEDARKKLIGSADALTGRPITLPRNQLAGFSSTTQDAFRRANQGIGAYQPSLNQASQQFGLAGQGLQSAVNRFGSVGGDIGSQRGALFAVGAPLASQTAQLNAAGQTFNPQTAQLQAAGQTFAPQNQLLQAAQAGIDPQALQSALAANQLSGSEGILGGLANRGPAGLQEARSAALLGGGDISGRIAAFQDPFQQQVVDSFQQEAARSAELARSRANQQAIGSGAFGGSRSGVEAAELERNIADVTQRNVSGLLSQGYGQALGAAEREAGRLGQLSGQLSGIEQLQYQLPQGVAAQMQAGAAQRGAVAQGLGAQNAQRQALAQAYGQQGAQRQALAAGYGQQGAQRQALAAGFGQQGAQRQALAAGYGQQGQQLRDQAQGFGQLAAGTGALAGQEAGIAGARQQLGGAFAGLAGLQQQLPAQDVALLSQVGSQQQQQAQRALDLERQNILQQTYEPYQRVGYLSDILKGQPSTQSTLTTSTDPRGNPLSQALGAGISLAGIFGSGGFGSGYLFGPNGAQLAGKV
tara:strand:+ start:555 stop:2168 length:1614 start_codon:yes stop_codon:yes gene_type:complete